MSAISPLLRLPRELRDEIYEYVALTADARLTLSGQGRVTSRSSLLLVSKTVGEEFQDALHSAAPVVTAEVHDFDFAHVVSFLVGLLPEERSHESNDAHAASKRPSPSHRQLNLLFFLTRDCRKHLDKLELWLGRADSQPTHHHGPSFTTAYAVHETTTAGGTSSTITSITFMRIIDELYCDWYLQTMAGPRKEEIRKVCDCLAEGEAELLINRSRTTSVPSGPRMGGLEMF